jgi:O-antigen/teichoic acid export membrane protein
VAVNFTSNDHFTNILVFIVASATIFQSLNVVDMYFQSQVMGKYIVYANVFGLLLSSLVKIALILYHAPLIAFAWLVVFDSFILAVGYLYFYIRKSSFRGAKQFSFWRFDKSTAIALLNDSWPLILSGMVIAIYMKIDQVMIKEMMNAEAVGQYAAAVRISEAWYFIPMVITSSLFPAIINAKKQSEELYYARLQRLYDLMVWLAIGIALPMTFLSDWVIKLLYGVQYIEAAGVLKIYIWAGVLVFFGTARGHWILTENLQRLAFGYLFMGSIVNIVLNFILITKIGIDGSALATIISLVSIVLFFPILNKETRISVKMFLNSFNIVRIKYDSKN